MSHVYRKRLIYRLLMIILSIVFTYIDIVTFINNPLSFWFVFPLLYSIIVYLTTLNALVSKIVVDSDKFIYRSLFQHFSKSISKIKKVIMMPKKQQNIRIVSYEGDVSFNISFLWENSFELYALIAEISHDS